MPTGYTAGVQDGTIVEFSDFAMRCARGMGACITMRDDSTGTPIPEEFQPSQYSNERLVEVFAAIKELEEATDEQIAAMAAKEYQETHDRWANRVAEKRLTGDRYEAMLAKVRAWNPPSQDHEGLKKFMEQQLTESIPFDCPMRFDEEPQPVDAGTWHAKKLAELHEDVVYHKKNQAEEDGRVAGRNLWLRQLRNSL
jgi:hypothetical protein